MLSKTKGLEFLANLEQGESGICLWFDITSIQHVLSTTCCAFAVKDLSLT